MLLHAPVNKGFLVAKGIQNAAGGDVFPEHILERETGYDFRRQIRVQFLEAVVANYHPVVSVEQRETVRYAFNRCHASSAGSPLSSGLLSTCNQNP